MNIWKKLKDSIHPEDDEGPFDDEFDDDYPSGMNNNIGSMNSDMGDFGSSYNMSGNPYANSNNNSTQTSPNYQYQNSPQPQSTPVSSSISISGGSDMQSPLEIKIVKPENFDSVARIAELLMSKKTVVLNLEETNKEVGRRLLDFLKGVSFAIGGQMKLASEKTYVITPNASILADSSIKAEDNSDKRDIGGY